MKIKFSRKAGIITFITVVIVFAIGGVILDRMHDNRFTITKLPDGAEGYSEEEQAVNVNPAPEENSDGRININTAGAETLVKLDGIGKSTAEKIIKYREENGEFMAVEEIMKVSGIGKSKFETIKDSICVE